MTIPRLFGRAFDQLRPVTLRRGWQPTAEGSALISQGSTRVLCTATFERGVPRWLKGKGEGWVTAEYAMLPRSGAQRSLRESVRGGPSGRTHEISRLIGRSLRAVVDRVSLGENTVILDCDVLQADGGTRCAAITGAWVALAQALEWARESGILDKNPLIEPLAAVSAGIVEGRICLDLDYAEDVRAQTDMNVVLTGSGDFVELQGTAESKPFGEDQLRQMLDLAKKGVGELLAKQREAMA